MPYTVLSLTATAILVIVFSLYFFIKKKDGTDWLHAIYFITVFAVGTALYILGLLYNDDRHSGVLSLFTIATAIWLSLKSFCWDFGAPFVSGLAQDNAMYTVAMFAHFIAAIMFSFLIAIKLLGKNVGNRIRVFINKYFCSKYIVVGVGGQAEVFLRSLDYKKRRRTTVVLEAKWRGKKNDLIDNGFAVVAVSGGAEYARVRIFVKITEDVLEYNSMLNGDGAIDNEIAVFGVLDETVNESYVIDEKMEVIAKRIANNYSETAGKEKTTVVTKWDAMTEFKRESNRGAAMSIRTKLNLLGFEFNECVGGTDNRAVMEVYNKKYGMDVSERKRAEKISAEKAWREKADAKFVDFVERDASGGIIDNARNNLARLEHQRWNTLHLVSGWTKFEIADVTAKKARQDEKSKQHACITTFEGLSDLRERQAEDAVAEAKKSGKELSRDEALSNADTVCYDFDLMDKLFKTLGSNYSVTLR